MATISGENDVNDTLVGTDTDDEIFGLGGNDRLTGGAGKDILHGGAGDDYLEAGGFGIPYDSTAFHLAVDDILDGGEGNDSAFLDYSHIVREADQEPIRIHFVFGQSFQIQIEGFTGATVTDVENIYIRLADGDDDVTLGKGNDTISGGQGNDTIHAGAGDDSVQDEGGRFDFDGGAGTDRLSFDWRTYTWDMTFDLVTGEGKAYGTDAPANYGTAIGFERLDYLGSSGMDSVYGGAGNDSFVDSYGGGYFDGRGGDDNAYLSGSNTGSLIGGAGNDSLSGQYAGVYLDGGEGNDTLVGGGLGDDTIYGGSGRDVIGDIKNFGILRDDFIDAGGDDDIVYAGRDTAEGTGNAIIKGGAGIDKLVVGLGNLHSFDAQTDQGKHLAEFGTISGFEVFEIDGSDPYTGFDGNDNIATLDGNDVLRGWEGDDTLNGRGGDDMLEGGEGADKLIGGAGSDTASYHSSYVKNVINLADPSQNQGDAEGDSYDGIENVIGGIVSDTITGDGNDNILAGGDGDINEIDYSDGNDVLDGGGGTDTAVFTEKYADYEITLNKDGSYLIHDKNPYGTGDDILINIEKAQFKDKLVTLGDPAGNKAPTGLKLSNADIVENAKVGTVVGKLSARDADGDALTYALASDGGGAFDLNGTSLVSSRKLNFEAQQSYSVKVEVSDGSHTISKTFIITVDDVMETIRGTAKANVLKGGIGADQITGLGGNDKLTGGKGNDVFVFSTGFDKDTITDFDAKNAGNDRVDLSGLKSIHNYNELKQHMAEKGHDVVIDAGHGDMLTLAGVDIDHLGKGDFLF